MKVTIKGVEFLGKNDQWTKIRINGEVVYVLNENIVINKDDVADERS